MLGAGTDFRDVSTDEGHGVWAMTSSTVYYFHGGATSTYTDRQRPGAGAVARGPSDYWCGPGFGGTCPATYNVTFTSVAGGTPGQVVVGNIGYIADRLDVDPVDGRGAERRRLEGDLDAAARSDGARWRSSSARSRRGRSIVDLNGTYNGTAYMGGWHGTSAFHNIGSSRTRGICGSGCGDYEEHIHGFFNGGTQPGGARRARARHHHEGDLWMGDADVISFVPQRSAGANADFFQPVAIPGQPNASALDVFPGVTDNTYGLARRRRAAACTWPRTATAWPTWRRRPTRRPTGRRRTSCRRTT